MPSIFLCSLDSFLVSLAIGLLDRSQVDRQKLIASFAAFDLLGTFLGLSLRSLVSVSPASSVAAVLISISFAAIATAILGYARRVPALLLWLPFLLSADNFLAGLLDGRGVPSPWLAGPASALLAWSGFAAAHLIRPKLSPYQLWAGSMTLGVLAFVFFS